MPAPHVHGLDWSADECDCPSCQEIVGVVAELGEDVLCPECGHVVALDPDATDVAVWREAS